MQSLDGVFVRRLARRIDAQKTRPMNEETAAASRTALSGRENDQGKMPPNLSAVDLDEGN